MSLPEVRATTVLAVRKDGRVAMGGDGQVTMGDTVVKGSARKVRMLKDGKILAGFAGAVADAFALFEKLEEKLERYPGNLTKAIVELAKDWRTDRYLRRLNALLAVADLDHLFLVSGDGDVIEPDDDIAGHRLGRRLRPCRGPGAPATFRPRSPGHRRRGRSSSPARSASTRTRPHRAGAEGDEA